MSSGHAPIAFVIPGDIETLSGGYGYARAVMEAWRQEGVPFQHVPLPGDYPFPSERSLAETAERLAAIPDGNPILVDGLAYGAIPPDLLKQAGRAMTVLLHHPLGLETGLDHARAEALLASEKAAVALARHVVVTSAETARTVVRLFQVAPQAVTVAVPGTHRRPRSSRPPPPFVLSLGSIVPRKGHSDLVAALSRLTDREWTAHLVGSRDASPETVREVERAIAEAGLAERISLPGALSGVELDRLFAKASIFALASHYEGYGMAFAEALAAGLPIVGYRAGAVPDLVPEEAGILLEPGDIAALADAIDLLLTDEAHARKMAERGFLAGQALPDWPQTARLIAEAVRGASR